MTMTRRFCPPVLSIQKPGEVWNAISHDSLLETVNRLANLSGKHQDNGGSATCFVANLAPHHGELPASRYFPIPR